MSAFSLHISLIACLQKVLHPDNEPQQQGYQPSLKNMLSTFICIFFLQSSDRFCVSAHHQQICIDCLVLSWLRSQSALRMQQLNPRCCGEDSTLKDVDTAASDFALIGQREFHFVSFFLTLPDMS